MTQKINVKIGDKLVCEVVINHVENKQYEYYLGEHSSLYQHYEEMITEIVEGNYAITYVEDDVIKTKEFKNETPFLNVEEFVKVFEDLPVSVTYEYDAPINGGALKEFSYKY